MRYCPHCNQPVFPEDEDSEFNNEVWWHSYCLEDAQADAVEDWRLDDPRHTEK